MRSSTCPGRPINHFVTVALFDPEPWVTGPRQGDRRADATGQPDQDWIQAGVEPKRPHVARPHVSGPPDNRTAGVGPERARGTPFRGRAGASREPPTEPVYRVRRGCTAAMWPAATCRWIPTGCCRPPPMPRRAWTKRSPRPASARKVADALEVVLAHEAYSPSTRCCVSTLRVPRATTGAAGRMDHERRAP